MARVPQMIKIAFSLKTTSGDGPVFFKADGTRFDQNRTIKLLKKSKDPQAAVYSAVYDTEGVAHTKRGQWQCVQVSIQFMVAGLFETTWQVKFYSYKKGDHCQWGNSFHSIEYECKPIDTHSLMSIIKETYL